MSPPRSQMSDADATNESARITPTDETPELNIYEIHSERTVFTEPGNTDGWIATDMTVTPSD